MDDAVEKAETINGIVNIVGESGKETTRISNIRDTFGRTKQALIEVKTSSA